MNARHLPLLSPLAAYEAQAAELLDSFRRGGKEEVHLAVDLRSPAAKKLDSKANPIKYETALTLSAADLV